MQEIMGRDRASLHKCDEGKLRKTGLERRECSKAPHCACNQVATSSTTFRVCLPMCGG